MQHEPYIPDHHDRMALARGWAALRAIVGQLALIAMLATPGQVLMAHRLVRVGEAMARRLLLARAMMSPLPAIRALTTRAREALAAAARNHRRDPRDMRHTPPPPRGVLFRLAEPLARFPTDAPAPRRALPSGVRVAQYGVLTVRTWSTHGDWTKPPIRIAGAPLPGDAAAPDAPAPPDHSALLRRIAALKDVAARPGDHVRRMARWISRQRSAPHGRRGPLRPGRAPGQVSNPRRRTLEQDQLADASFLASRTLAASIRAPPVAAPA